MGKFIKKIQRLLYKPILRVKGKNIGSSIISGLPEKVVRILDVGCGDMMISQEVFNHFRNKRVKCIGLDVIDTNLTDLQPVLYDGVTFPFPDNYFDFVYTSFTLHHCDDPTKILAEMKRVSNKRIVIVEEIYENQITKYVTHINDWIFNRLESLTVNIPFNFKKDNEWHQIFEKLNLKCVSQKKVYQLPLWFITKQIMYLLEK